MAREHLVNHETGAEAWEFEEVTNGTLVLKTNLKKCVVCGVGDIVRHNSIVLIPQHIIQSKFLSPKG